MCIQYLSDKKSISKLHNSTILHFAVKVWPTAAITLQKYFFSLVQLTPYEYGFRGYLHFFCTIANKNTATTYVRPGGLCCKTREICHGENIYTQNRIKNTGNLNTELRVLIKIIRLLTKSFQIMDKCFGKRNGSCVCQSWTEHQEKGAWGMQYAEKEATEIKYSSQLCTNWIVFISQWVNQVWVYLAWYFLSAGCNQLLSSFLHGWSRCLHALFVSQKYLYGT